MASIPTKVEARLAEGIKRFQPVISSAFDRDVNESDTVRIVAGILAEVLGYDRYTEVTTEYCIRGTYVDLAIKLDGKPLILIEVKAIGMELKDQHMKQAVDYAANQGTDWVILTNARTWKVFHITFSKPINQDLVFELDFQTLNHRKHEDIETMFLLAREGAIKSVLSDYFTQRQATSRFFLGAILLSDPVLDVVRRELKRVSPVVKIKNPDIKNILMREVIKREVVEGDKAETARKKVQRAGERPHRIKPLDHQVTPPTVTPIGEPP